jgi:hypothetical protein
VIDPVWMDPAWVNPAWVDPAQVGRVVNVSTGGSTAELDEDRGCSGVCDGSTAAGKESTDAGDDAKRRSSRSCSSLVSWNSSCQERNGVTASWGRCTGRYTCLTEGIVNPHRGVQRDSHNPEHKLKALVSENGGKVAGQQGSRAAGQQGSRVAGQQGSRAAGQQGSRAAGQQGSRAAGQQGTPLQTSRNGRNFDLNPKDARPRDVSASAGAAIGSLEKSEALELLGGIGWCGMEW